MTTCKPIIMTRWNMKYGKTHKVIKNTKTEDPANMEFITACGRRFHHLMVNTQMKKVDCKTCLRAEKAEGK